MSLIGKALQGAAQVAVPAALEAQRAQIMELRDARLNEYQTARDTRQNEFTAGQNQLQRDHVSRESALGREHTSTEAQRTREHASTEAGLTRTHQSQLQDTALEAAAQRHRESLQVQREGQSIQRRQLDIAERGANLDHQIKELQLNNAKRVESLREQHARTADPVERARISENISILTGKDNDNYIPVPLKDAIGAITGYEIFDKKRGAFVTGSGAGRKAPTAADIQKLGALSNDPAAKAAFDEEFGSGSADRILAEMRKPPEQPSNRPASTGNVARGIIQGAQQQ